MVDFWLIPINAFSKNELKLLNLLNQPQSMQLEDLATKAFLDSASGKTKLMGFDEL